MREQGVDEFRRCDVAPERACVVRVRRAWGNDGLGEVREQETVLWAGEQPRREEGSDQPASASDEDLLRWGLLVFGHGGRGRVVVSSLQVRLDILLNGNGLLSKCTEQPRQAEICFRRYGDFEFDLKIFDPSRLLAHLDSSSLTPTLAGLEGVAEFQSNQEAKGNVVPRSPVDLGIIASYMD
ncbi:hypothetical protein VTI28DRAFT_2288 [Corynascus sepedonium]